MTTALYIGAIIVVISITLIFAVIHNKRLAKIAQERLEQEQTQSRTTTILSQLNPHFMYNIISAINDLCEGKPEAQKALVAFSDYLRVTISSLKHTKPVSFVTELNHIKHYLSLEKLRFEERMQVIYDITATDFMVPVLSVQPIVENAVSHGLFNKLGGGTVRIRTTETETEYSITVADDGVGFDTEILNEAKNNSGIENVRKRIASMCGGTLDIYSKPGVGTRVHINIPKAKEEAK